MPFTRFNIQPPQQPNSASIITPAPATTAVPTLQNVKTIVDNAKKALQGRLLDPSSLQIHSTRYLINSDDSWVWFDYSAKNRLGGADRDYIYVVNGRVRTTDQVTINETLNFLIGSSAYNE